MWDEKKRAAFFPTTCHTPPVAPAELCGWGARRAGMAGAGHRSELRSSSRDGQGSGIQDWNVEAGGAVMLN